MRVLGWNLEQRASARDVQIRAGHKEFELLEEGEL